MASTNLPESSHHAQRGTKAGEDLKSHLVGVRLPLEDLELLDEWIARQGSSPSRPEAMRRLLEVGLASTMSALGSMVIELEDVAGSTVLVNEANIAFIVGREEHTIITFVGGTTVQVLQSPTEISLLLDRKR
jgi:hypothetical protein